MSSTNIIFDLQKEAHKQLNESTEKFAYYIIALCVSCIGFSIYQTKDDILDYPKILIFISLISWATSIYFGLIFIKNKQYGLYLSYMIYENQRNNFQLSRDNPQKIKFVESEFKNKFRKNNTKTKTHYRNQLISFFTGVAYFIVWHIFEMYMNTIN